MNGQIQPLGDDRIHRLVQLLKEAKSGDYLSVAKKLKEARWLFHEQIAEQASEPLNRHLASMPDATVENKQDLARFANTEMRELGLAIRCDRSREAATLHVDCGKNAPNGRFQTELIHGIGGRIRTRSSSTLFPIEIMAYPDRRQPLADYWAQKALKDTASRILE